MPCTLPATARVILSHVNPFTGRMYFTADGCMSSDRGAAAEHYAMQVDKIIADHWILSRYPVQIEIVGAAR